MARGRKPGCYVYLIRDGVTPLYVGKGTGRRGEASARKHGGRLEILEAGLTDDLAFAAERKWIAELKPVNNISPGGNGGRAKKRPAMKRSADEILIERLGSRVYAARFLVSRIYEGNCDRFGISKVDLSRLREVAYGRRV